MFIWFVFHWDQEFKINLTTNFFISAMFYFTSWSRLSPALILHKFSISSCILLNLFNFFWATWQNFILYSFCLYHFLNFSCLWVSPSQHNFTCSHDFISLNPEPPTLIYLWSQPCATRQYFRKLTFLGPRPFLYI